MRRECPPWRRAHRRGHRDAHRHDHPSCNGAGIWSVGALELDDTSVSGNIADLDGGSGSGRGGGLFIGEYLLIPDDVPLTPALTATDSEITGNLITFSAGMTGSAGGLFTETTPSLTDVDISGNTPEPQCAGCSGAPRLAPPTRRLTGVLWARHHGERTLPRSVRWLR